MTLQNYRKILSIAKWVQENIELERVSADEYERTFGKRSAKDILAQKKVSYMNACPDFTLAYIHLIKQEGFTPKLVVEERESPRTQQPTLHFATEIEANGKIITVDFADSRKLIYYEGKYDPLKSSNEKSYKIHRYSTQKLGYQTKLNQFLGVRDTTMLYKRFPRVSPHAARAVFEAMKKADTPRLFQLVFGRKRTMRRIR